MIEKILISIAAALFVGISMYVLLGMFLSWAKSIEAAENSDR